MPENGPSGLMSGEWKRSTSHRATPRLYYSSGSLDIQARDFSTNTATYRLRGTTKGMGRFIRSSIKVRDSESGREVDVPILGEIRPELAAAPSTVFLRADGANLVGTFLIARTGDGVVGEVASVEAPDGVKVEELPRGLASRVAPFKVSLPRSALLPSGASIRVRTRLSSEVVSIHIAAPAAAP
jgi:hypothetical protein